MRIVLLICGLVLHLFLGAQTYVYSVKPDGSEDKANYYYFFNDLVFKCENCSYAFKDDSSFEKYTRVIINENKLTILNKDGKNHIPDSIHAVGFLLKNKKIILAKTEIEKNGNKAYANNVSSDEKKKAPYIKNNKIYTANDQLMAIIDGDEIYGAAWWLMR